jgi:hypothetical protein
LKLQATYPVKVEDGEIFVDCRNATMPELPEVETVVSHARAAFARPPHRSSVSFSRFVTQEIARHSPAASPTAPFNRFSGAASSSSCSSMKAR